MSRLAAATSIVLACLLGGTLAAEAAPPRGFGSRETAMAGGVSADVSDFSANYYNPAGLARARGVNLGVGYFRSDVAFTTNGQESVEHISGLSGGLVAPGKILGVPVALGVGLHSLYLSTNLAVSLTDWLQIGGGLAFVSATRARLDISGYADIARPTNSEVRHQLDADLTSVRYPQAGLRAALAKNLALALVYREGYQLPVDLRARLEADLAGITTAVYEYERRTIRDFAAREIVLGWAWNLVEALEVVTDFTWVQFSAYRPPAPARVVLDIPPPAGGWPASITPPTAPAPPIESTTRLNDRIVPRVGTEWRALRTESFRGFVRAGYELGLAATGRSTDPDRHAFSSGLGLRYLPQSEALPGDIRLDLHFRISVPVGGADPLASDVNCATSTTQWISNVGTTLTVTFDRSAR